MQFRGSWLDRFGLGATVVADLVLVGSSLFIIANGIIEKIGFVVIAIVVVLFAVRGWIKGGVKGKALWICFALVALFFDLSYVLVATDTNEISTETDKRLLEYKEEKKRLDGQLDDLNVQYKEASKRATMDELNVRIKLKETDIKELNQKIERRTELIESGEAVKISSDRLATAIYDAATSKDPARITYLLIFSLLFAGIQLTMITAVAAEEKRSEKAQTRKMVIKTEAGTQTVDVPEAKIKVIRRNDPITQFVRLTWSYLRQKNVPRAQPKHVFLKLRSPMGGFDEVLYDRLRGLIEQKGYISKDGLIVESDEEKVIAWLRQEVEGKDEAKKQ